MKPDQVASRIQHTNVRPDATRADIERLLGECLEHSFGGAMVNPIWLPVTLEALRGNEDTAICTAIVPTPQEAAVISTVSPLRP